MLMSRIAGGDRRVLRGGGGGGPRRGDGLQPRQQAGANHVAQLNYLHHRRQAISYRTKQHRLISILGHTSRLQIR